MGEIQTDMDTYESSITDPRVYNTKFAKRGMDPDAPTFHQALSGLEADKYIEAMKEEITNLKQMNTWVLVDRDPHMRVIKGTWELREINVFSYIFFNLILLGKKYIEQYN